MRRSMAPAIPAKLYRHFAVITVVLTLLLAMFAEGENDEARTDEIAAPRPQPQAQPAQFAMHEVDRAARSFANDMSADFDNDFGQPMDRMVSAGASAVIPEGEIVPPALAPVNPTLSAAERERMLQRLRERGLAAPPAAVPPQG